MTAAAPTYKKVVGPTVFRRSIIGLVDSNAEALVAPAPPHHVLPRAMEGHLVVDVISLSLRHGRLEALQGAGLPEAQGWAKSSTR